MYSGARYVDSPRSKRCDGEFISLRQGVSSISSMRAANVLRTEIDGGAQDCARRSPFIDYRDYLQSFVDHYCVKTGNV